MEYQDLNGFTVKVGRLYSLFYQRHDQSSSGYINNPRTGIPLTTIGNTVAKDKGTLRIVILNFKHLPT